MTVARMQAARRAVDRADAAHRSERTLREGTSLMLRRMLDGRSIDQEDSRMTQSVASHDPFEVTFQKTNRWLNHLMRVLPTDNRHTAYIAMRATLHALRDRITVEEVAQLGAQLPMLIRGFYYEGWNPTGKPSKALHRQQFLDRITKDLKDIEGMDAEDVARAVFTVLVQRISDGEIEDVKHILPADIRELWP
jgi:uncharacterized protein (DUF2267 family)